VNAATRLVECNEIGESSANIDRQTPGHRSS
jgi:hypothetical protein